MAKIPLLKKDKDGNTIISIHKNLYRSPIIRDAMNSIDGIRMDSGSKRYFRLKLETKDLKRALEFCNYLFSEHR